MIPKILPPLVAVLMLTAFTRADPPATRPALDPAHAVPYIDKAMGGSTDPCIIYNDAAGEWFVYYTARRANLSPPGPGVEWVHGTAIGIASTKTGREWSYRGVAKGDDFLGDPIAGKRSWWAPHVIKVADTYHLFVTYVNGIYPDFGIGKAYIKHFTSTDGLTFTFVQQIDLGEDVIDPCVRKMGDEWWMWYKHQGKIFYATSPDLHKWTRRGLALKADVGYEAPYVFSWKGKFWLLVDTMKNGSDVYVSPDGRGDWERAGHLWAAHPAVAEFGDRRVLIFHGRDTTSPDGDNHGRRSQLMLSELHVNEQGELTQ